MVITRADWRINGDLMQWLAERYPGLTRAEFEAAFRLLADPGITDETADQVEVLLQGCTASKGGRWVGCG